METFTFNYIKNSSMPKLGWVMRINKEQKDIDIHVGEYVECQTDFFVSGVWDGEYSLGNFDEAEFFCGTGVKIIDDKIVVYSPTHERQRICYMCYTDTVYVSNSIPLLLASSEETLDINYNEYEKVLCSIIHGTQEYEKNIPLANKKIITQIFCADLVIDNSLQIMEVPKKKHRDFVDYNDYYSSLINVCKKIRDNGVDLKRRKTYKLATTASSGYDSACCAAVAHTIGCDTLMTFKGGTYDEDSGVGVATQLGYTNIVERNHKDFKQRKGCVDAEYFCCGDIGTYLEFVAFEHDFKDHIVFIGTSGSYIYNKDTKANEFSKREGYNYFTANLSFSENALRVGYIVLPMCLYASSAAISIKRITNSEEMRPWTLFNSYDRPIPRRILETCGVKRESFGHEKYGAGFCLSKNFTLKQVKNKMSEEGYKNFENWIKIKGNNRWNFRRCYKMIRYHISCVPDYYAYAMSKLGIRIDLGERSNYIPNPGIASKLIIWGIEKVSNEYRMAIKGE